MHEFNGRTLETITNALRRCDATVPLTKTWETLNQLFGVGTPSSTRTRLALSERDHETLRRLTQRHMTFDPLTQTTDDLKGDRMKLAGTTRNEKVSGQAVSAGIVMVGSATGVLHLASGTYRLPPGATLNVPTAELHGCTRVVLIENLPVMYNLVRYRWPDGVADLPMLFRGSPQHTPAAVTKALAGVTEVICFPDYDPQGLMNSLTQKFATALILPSPQTIDRIVDRQLDKPDDFTRQQGARDWLSTRQYPPVKRLLEQRLAISQESMAGSELVVYPMKLEDAGRQSPIQAVDFL